MPVRVFHGDDSDAYRLLIAETLPEQDPGIEVVGGAGTPEEIVAGVRRTRPDVVLLDQMGGAGLVRRVRDAAGGARVVILSGFDPGGGDPEVVASADAYVVKTAPLSELADAVRGG